MTRRLYTRVIGLLALGAGGIIIVRDTLEVHSIPYGIAGVGMLAFGAWRLQVAARQKS